MDLIFLLSQLQAHPVLCRMTLDGLVTFSRLVGHLKRDIIQPQAIVDSNPRKPPPALPNSIALFIGNSLGIPVSDMDRCWDIMKNYVWEMPTTPLIPDDYLLFKYYGWKLGISEFT